MLLTDSQAPLAPSRPRSRRSPSAGATPAAPGRCPAAARPCCSAWRATERVGDRKVSRQNGALNFRSRCSSRCLWTAGSPTPAPGAGLRLPVTLPSGSAFRGTRDSLPVPGCWLSRDSAAESPAVSRPRLSRWPVAGRSVAKQCLPAGQPAPRPSPGAHLWVPEPVLPGQPPPALCCP